MFSLANSSFLLSLAFKVLHYRATQPSAPIVIQMDHVPHLITLPPLPELMNVHGHKLAVHELPATPDTIPVEPWRGVTIPLIKLCDPGVDSANFFNPVHVPGGRGAVVSEPGQLGGVEHSGHNQLISDVRMVDVLVVDGIFQPKNAVS